MSGPVPSGPGRIWIVDDTPDPRNAVGTLLDDRGYAVETMALAGLEAALASGRRPDVVLIDPGANGTALEQLPRGHLWRTTSVILWTSASSEIGGEAAWLANLDDHLAKDIPARGVATRIELALRTARRQLETSPLTGLPGNSVIRRRLTVAVDSSDPLAVIHSDLDHFKALNDHYGFTRGDAVIRFCGHSLCDAADTLDRSPFVGHVGGDDFVVIAGLGDMETFCKTAIARFDEGILEFYDAVDRERGWIESVDRRGNTRTFPIVSMSLGVATSERRPFDTPWDAARIAAEMKEYAKRQPGSNFQVDRRT